MRQEAPGGWLDPVDWTSSSRGRSWGFDLPDLVIIQTVRRAAQKRTDQLDLLTCVEVKIGGEYRSLYRISSWRELVNPHEWQHFIRSHLLTPVLPPPSPRAGGGWTVEFATNGLIALWHPEPSGGDGQPARSRLGVVTRVANVQTGEVRMHKGYDQLYAELKRELTSHTLRARG